MKHLARTAAAALTAAGMAATAVFATSATAASTSGQTAGTGRLVAVRAAHHPGFDRLVLEFSGPVPAQRDVRWVDRIVQDGSGNTVRVAGHAFLKVAVSPAVAHDADGHPTVRHSKTYALPNLTQTVLAGDFEAVVTLGAGYQRKESVHTFTLTSPSRLVIDVSVPYSTTSVGAWFLDRDRYADGTEPYTERVSRPAIAPAVARQALERLFAGPTVAEPSRGLRMVRSHATGFADLTISDGVARVRLTGGCDSGGSTFTVANEITPTLKQFASVDYVKIYSPSGHTERPTGRSDSIPACLEP